MAVVGDNRGVRDRPVAQRPDGSWSFEDARRRRDQRQGGGTAPSLARDRRPGGGPLRARAQPGRQPHHRRHAALRAGDAPGTRRQRRSRTAGWQRSDRRGDHARARDRAARSSTHRQQRRRGPAASSLGAPTQHAAGSHTVAGCARAPSWVIACIVSAGVVTALVVELDLRRGYHRSAAPRPRSAASGTAAATASLTRLRRPDSSPWSTPRIATSVRHDRRALARPRLSRHRQTPSVHTAARQLDPTRRARPHHRPAAHPKRSIPRNSQAPRAPARPRAPRRQDQVKDLPATQPHTSPSSNSGSSSSSPSKATLRSLVTGAGTCSCQ